MFTAEFFTFFAYYFQHSCKLLYQKLFPEDQDRYSYANIVVVFVFSYVPEFGSRGRSGRRISKEAIFLTVQRIVRKRVSLRFLKDHSGGVLSGMRIIQ